MGSFFDDNILSFVDIETSGTSTYHSHILEIAIVQKKSHKVINTYQTLINPGIDYLNPYISKITGIKTTPLKHLHLTIKTIALQHSKYGVWGYAMLHNLITVEMLREHD